MTEGAQATTQIAHSMFIIFFLLNWSFAAAFNNCCRLRQTELRVSAATIIERQVPAKDFLFSEVDFSVLKKLKTSLT
jgi:hypothetical protein